MILTVGSFKAVEGGMSDGSRGVCGKEQQAQTCFLNAEKLKFIIPRLKTFSYTFFVS